MVVLNDIPVYNNSIENRSKLLYYPNYEDQNITLLHYMSSKKQKNQKQPLKAIQPYYQQQSKIFQQPHHLKYNGECQRKFKLKLVETLRWFKGIISNLNWIFLKKS